MNGFMGSTEIGRSALGRFVIPEIDLFPLTIELDLFQSTKSKGRFFFNHGVRSLPFCLLLGRLILCQDSYD